MKNVAKCLENGFNLSMKTMSIIYLDGADASRFGTRIVFSKEQESKLSKEFDGIAFFSKASSTDIANLIEEEVSNGRQKWAQLTIEIDATSLVFWLPDELEIFCQVFSMSPFPTAKTLLKSSPDATELNRHWLSRLPKEAKSKKNRQRFLKYVASRPSILQEFLEFYNQGSKQLFQE